MSDSAAPVDELDVQVPEPPIEDDAPRLVQRRVDLRRGVRRRPPRIAGEPDDPDAAGAQQRPPDLRGAGLREGEAPGPRLPPVPGPPARSAAGPPPRRGGGGSSGGGPAG